MTSARLLSSRTILRLLSVATAFATLVAMFGLPQGPARAGGSNRWNNPERCFMKKINAARARHGLHATNTDPHLGYVARLHAKELARAGSVYHDHQFGEKITNWYRLGQNTGRGTTCRQLHKAFMQDPSHREIILGKWAFLGVGMSASNGRIYVQQIFEASANPGNVYNTP